MVGRPRKKRSEKRHPVQVRLNEIERRAFTEEAERLGISMTAWIRFTCRKAARLTEAE
jgi:hypothetical protein